MFKSQLSLIFKSLTLILLASCMANVHADSLRKSLFSDAESVMQTARDKGAPLLAPESFEEAMDAYEKADKRYKKKQKVDSIKNDLANASTYFYKSIESADLARITFKSTIKARKDALGVNAARLAQDEWSKAEKQFKSAAIALETGSLSGANKKASNAESTYREAELIAIKSSYLSQIRELLDKAKKERVSKYAPDTLEDAEILLRKAERELTENRYDTDYPRSLAKQSLYQAKHSLYLANYIRKLKDDDVTTEQLILKMETPLASIGDTLDMVAEFDEGVDVAAKKINANIEDLLRDSQEYAELKMKMAKLEKEHAVLENRLGIQSKRLANQEAQQEKIDAINKLFSPHEAVVFMQGDDILIRAVGLSFAPGSSKVNTENIRLLKKLEQVFDIFRGYDVRVEGHTDSFGSDSANMALSFDRANAVREYFTVNMPGFSDALSKATGYGETQPIANNETAAGRTKNRRIDLVFSPRR